MGMPGLEPGTFVLSGQRSSQLSYMPISPLGGLGKILLFSKNLDKTPRKEVIQPLLPERLPCYDLVLIADLTLVPLSGVSGAADFAHLTGGVLRYSLMSPSKVLLPPGTRFSRTLADLPTFQMVVSHS